MALSLYRKYRPKVFSDVVGQEHVERTLVNAISEGAVANAYLFCGPRGTGKTTTARLLAKALLCERGPQQEPDGTCEQCLAIAAGTHPDVYELDAASRTGVDNVRDEIISRVQFSPTRGRYKIYIIDEVHMLSTAAFNALLKTLEEPPEHVVFILCTTDPHKVPETIQSRCQRFDFRRFSTEEIVGYLERICKGEGFSYEVPALEYIASKSAGGMRDATTSLEQAAVFTDGNITLEQTRGLFGQLDASGLFEIAGYIARRDTAACFTWIDRLVSTGVDLAQFAHDLAAHVRDLYVTALTGGGDGIVKCAEGDLPRYQQQAAAFGTPERLSRALTVCGSLVNELRSSSDARLSVEVALTRLCRPESDLTLESLAERVAALEEGAPARGAQGAPAGQNGQQSGRAARPQDGGAATDAQWGAVEPARPAWQEVAEQRKHDRAEAASAAGGPRQGVPLREAVAREQEREEREDGEPVARRQPQSQTRQQPQGERQARPEPEPQPQVRAQREAGPQPQADPQAQAQPGPQPQSQSQAQPQPQGQPEARPQSRPQNAMSPARLLAAVLTAVKREDVATGALLNGVTIQQEDDRYFLSFPKGAEFAMGIASKGAARDLIARAFKQVIGHDVSFECRIDSRGAAEAASPVDEAPAPTYDDRPPIYEDPGYDRPPSDYDRGFGGDAGFGSSGPSFDEPNFDAPVNTHVRPIDDETAANLADMLSAFGDGVKVQEVDDDQ